MNHHSQNPEDYLDQFGLTEFRPGQRDVIDAVLAGEHCLCIMPTGGGKSLCYQLPSVMRAGVTLVVSPLIALMKDQVDQLQQMGIAASFINSSLSMAEASDRMDRMVADDFDLMYIAPERFRSPRFMEALHQTNVQLLAIDEAHCISEWGHDFRHDYTRLGKFRQQMGHPQTIALILAYMPVNQAGNVLAKLSESQRIDVAERIAQMEQTPPDVVRKVEQILEKKVSSLLSTEMTKAGGPKALVDLLGSVDRATERAILDSLSESNPELADEIKNMMFVFEDIVQLDDRAVQSVLKEVDMKELGTALKGVNQEVQDKIYRNMSERAVEMLKEDMEFLGPIKMRAVEEAQQKVVAIIRRLEDAGEISIGRGEEDEFV